MKYGLVVVGFNRLLGLKRLIGSLLKANYYNDKVDLIISLDYSNDNSIYDYVLAVEWPFGEKTVRKFSTRQGLKKHILSCGDFLNIYDAIAVFEDDVVVSPSFYSFMRETVPFYCNDNSIAGISLYAYHYNVVAMLPFDSEKREHDVFFIQFPQSWGQVWMRNSFLDFLNWVNKQDNIVYDENTPRSVNSWPDNSSWLKLHVKYCVDNNKFFVYPYHSFTTCYSEVGEHVKKKQNLQQVPIVKSFSVQRFNLVDFNDANSIKYDVFFERVFDGEVLIDIYGQKKCQYYRYRYVLSPYVMNHKIIESFSLEAKPHEINYVDHVSGSDFFLYDMSIAAKNKNKKRLELKRFEYYYSIQGRYKKIVIAILEKLLSKFNL